jgi:hypothetical protein
LGRSLGCVIIHKEIRANFLPAGAPAPHSLLRAGTFKAEPLAASEDDFAKLPFGKEGGVAAQKSEFVARRTALTTCSWKM